MSIFEWPLKTGFTVLFCFVLSLKVYRTGHSAGSLFTVFTNIKHIARNEHTVYNLISTHDLAFVDALLPSQQYFSHVGDDFLSSWVEPVLSRGQGHKTGPLVSLKPTLPGRVVHSVTCLATDLSLTADPGVTSLIPAWSHTFVEIDHEIISTVILFPSAESFKKSYCQLQAKVCARSTG